MEELVRKKYAAQTRAEPILTPISPSQQPRKEKSPSPSPFPIPSTGKTPTPSPSPKPTQEENQPEKETTKQPSPTQVQQKAQQTPPIQPGPIPIPINLVFEKEILQVIHEDPLAEGEKISSEGKNGGGGLEQPATDSSALSTSASEKIPTVTIIPKNQEHTVQLVLEELAAKKREELGNTQKFIKSPFEASKVLKETPKDVGGESVKEGEGPKEKEMPKEGTGEEEPSKKDAEETQAE